MPPTIRTLASRAVTFFCVGLVALLAPVSATALASFEAFALSVLEVTTISGDLPPGLIISTSGATTLDATNIVPDVGPLSQAFAEASTGSGALPDFTGTDNLPSLAELEAELDLLGTPVDFSFDDTAGYAQAFVSGTADASDWVDASAFAELTVTLENTNESDLEVQFVVFSAIALAYAEVDDPLQESALGDALAAVEGGGPSVVSQVDATVPPGTEEYLQSILSGAGTVVVPAVSSIDFTLTAEALGEAHAPIPEPGAALLFAVGAIAMAGPLRRAPTRAAE